MPVCRHHFFKIQVYVLVDTDRCSSAFKRPSNIVLRWSDLTIQGPIFFFFFFFFFWSARGARVPAPPPLDPLLGREGGREGDGERESKGEREF